MKTIDFSGGEDVLIRNPDLTLQHVSEPYFRVTEISDGVKQILTDGAFSYLVEGRESAIVINTGYGSGSLFDYCKKLTDKRILGAVVLSSRFPECGAMGCFPRVYMTKETKETDIKIPASFAGVKIPTCDNITVIEDGYTFQLGGRELLAIGFSNGEAGSILIFDTRDKVLFVGDELTDFMVYLNNYSVIKFRDEVQKLAALQGETDLICSDYSIFYSFYIKRYLTNANRILRGRPPLDMIKQAGPSDPEMDENGRIVYNRGFVRPNDRPDRYPDLTHIKFSHVAECKVIYDERRIQD